MPTSKFIRPASLFLALLMFSGLANADDECKPALESASCTWGQIYNFYWQQALAEAVMVEAAEGARDMNLATPAPDSFASDLHATFENFLNPLNFAISDIEESEDGRALIVRVNPLRRGRNQLGLTVAINKPTVGKAIEAAIPEDQRAAIVERLEKLQEDVDDLTISLAFTRSTKTCEESNLKDGWCWGRRVETYQSLLAPLLVEVAAQRVESNPDSFAVDEALADIALASGVNAEGNLLELKLGQFAESKSEVVGLLQKAGRRDAGETKEEIKIYKEAGLENLSSLLDNQPQLTATASYRDPAAFGGPEEASFNLELQWGRKNLNWLFHENTYRETLRSLDETEIAKDKFVLTVSYKWRDAFQLEELLIPGEDGQSIAVEGFEAIKDESLEEFRAKLQWGQPVGKKIAGRQARFDLSIDGIWTNDDEKRSENRWIGTATLTVPLGDQMSLPISLKYADKPEFLTDTREDLGVHFGISYRLPWETE